MNVEDIKKRRKSLKPSDLAATKPDSVGSGSSERYSDDWFNEIAKNGAKIRLHLRPSPEVDSPLQDCINHLLSPVNDKHESPKSSLNNSLQQEARHISLSTKVADESENLPLDGKSAITSAKSSWCVNDCFQADLMSSTPVISETNSLTPVSSEAWQTPRDILELLDSPNFYSALSTPVANIASRVMDNSTQNASLQDDNTADVALSCTSEMLASGGDGGGDSSTVMELDAASEGCEVMTGRDVGEGGSCVGRGSGVVDDGVVECMESILTLLSNTTPSPHGHIDTLTITANVSQIQVAPSGNMKTDVSVNIDERSAVEEEKLSGDGVIGAAINSIPQSISLPETEVDSKPENSNLSQTAADDLGCVTTPKHFPGDKNTSLTDRPPASDSKRTSSQHMELSVGGAACQVSCNSGTSGSMGNKTSHKPGQKTHASVNANTDEQTLPSLAIVTSRPGRKLQKSNKPSNDAESRSTKQSLDLSKKNQRGSYLYPTKSSVVGAERGKESKLANHQLKTPAKSKRSMTDQSGSMKSHQREKRSKQDSGIKLDTKKQPSEETRGKRKLVGSKAKKEVTSSKIIMGSFTDRQIRESNASLTDGKDDKLSQPVLETKIPLPMSGDFPYSAAPGSAGTESDKDCRLKEEEPGLSEAELLTQHPIDCLTENQVEMEATNTTIKPPRLAKKRVCMSFGGGARKMKPSSEEEPPVIITARSSRKVSNREGSLIRHSASSLPVDECSKAVSSSVQSPGFDALLAQAEENGGFIDCNLENSPVSNTPHRTTLLVEDGVCGVGDVRSLAQRTPKPDEDNHAKPTRNKPRSLEEAAQKKLASVDDSGSCSPVIITSRKWRCGERGRTTKSRCRESQSDSVLQGAAPLESITSVSSSQITSETLAPVWEPTDGPSVGEVDREAGIAHPVEHQLPHLTKRKRRSMDGGTKRKKVPSSEVCGKQPPANPHVRKPKPKPCITDDMTLNFDMVPTSDTPAAVSPPLGSWLGVAGDTSAVSLPEPPNEGPPGQGEAEPLITVDTLVLPGDDVPAPAKRRSTRRMSADNIVMSNAPLLTPSPSDTELPEALLGVQIGQRRSSRIRRKSIELYKTMLIKREEMESGMDTEAGQEVEDGTRDGGGDGAATAKVTPGPVMSLQEVMAQSLALDGEGTCLTDNFESLASVTATDAAADVTVTADNASDTCIADTASDNLATEVIITPKTRGRPRAKPKQENLEDIYLNKLWQSQMPKEKTWETIFEDPPKRIAARGKSCYQSARKYKRSIHFNEYYTVPTLRLVKRQQKAAQLGWHQVDDVRDSVLTGLVTEKLSALDQELEEAEESGPS